jgi:hypothetical protein
MARNLTEFGSALKMVESKNYRIVVFAMMTNIVIDAGSAGNDHSTRLDAIEECLSPLMENLRYFTSNIPKRAQEYGESLKV